MKTKCSILALVALATIHAQLSTAHAQGSLTPPGAPAPTMKTLAQIEPRTPISSAPFSITVPGSYYLTTNLTVSGGTALTISTNGVTLDLNGFTISSTAPSAAGAGIFINNDLRNLTILNGFIQGGVTNNGSGLFSGSGFGYGIFNYPVQNVRISGVSVSGCLYDGINLGAGDSTVVESCTVRTVGGRGIFAGTIKGSVAKDCGNTAIYGNQVSDCRGECPGYGYGLFAITAQNCQGSSGGDYGVYANTAQNCYGSSSGSHGVVANTALNCQGISFSGTGLNAYTAENCFGSSTSGFGLNANTALNCNATSDGAIGLNANTAENCQGSSSADYGLNANTALNCKATSDSATGLNANLAENCQGFSNGGGVGVHAVTAENCFGSSSSGYGVFAAQIANGCNGNSSSGTGLYAFIASVCHGSTVTGTALSTPHNVNSF